MALDPLTVGLSAGPPGDDDEERAPGDDSPAVPLVTSSSASSSAAPAGSLAAANAINADHDSLMSESSLAAILSANEAANANNGEEDSEGEDGGDSVEALLARKRKLLMSMLDGGGSSKDGASPPASKRMAPPASTDTSASSFSAIAGWEKQWTPEGHAIYINKKTGDKSETKPKGFDDLQRELAYNESGQYAKDQQAAAAADTPGASGSGHYMDANNLMGAVAPEPKAKWAPPNGMSFKEYKEYKKRLKMKRNGVF